MSEIVPPSQLLSNDDLESLFVNNERLERIEAYLGRFNPIKTMRMERMEIRHSAILAWLLDPQETHGLADRFLKAFLGEALRGQSAAFPTALDIARADLRDAEIRREWQNIDVFIISRRNRWAFIVENKFGSRQSVGQLDRYAEKIRRIYGYSGNELAVRGVFLSLAEEEPQDPGYVNIRYATITAILERLLKGSDQQFSSDVRFFLQHYLEVLKEATNMSDELERMQQLARELYREHRKVLDFIVEHGAGSDFALAARSIFGDKIERLDRVQIEEDEFIFNGMNNSVVGFMPKAWYDLLKNHQMPWAGCEQWWMRMPLICWINLSERSSGTGGEMRLNAEVGPLADHSLRAQFIDAIQTEAKKQDAKNIKFRAKAAEKGTRYSRFYQNNSASVDDVRNPEEIKKKIRRLIRSFRNETGVVTEAVRSLITQQGVADQFVTPDHVQEAER